MKIIHGSEAPLYERGFEILLFLIIQEYEIKYP